MDDSVYQEARLFTNNIYSITVRSCLLLHQYHGGNREIAPLLRRTFWHLANYAAKSAQEAEEETTFHKMARKVVTTFRKKLSQQANSQFMAHEHTLICDYVRAIEVSESRCPKAEAAVA